MDIVTTSPNVTFEQLQPYLDDFHYDFVACDGLLALLVFYIVAKDVGKFIYNLIFGGIN